ncbi:MAG: HAD family phosphatase [Lachnospiraceae bacterium]|nr:HAD family phosphatase [Lachnospiraceae bacterium]
MFKAVVFDMDGVITDTEKLYRRYQLEEGRARGITDEEMEQVCLAIAGGNKYTNKPKFEAIVGRGIDYFEYREKMMARMDAHIKEHGVELKVGVKDTLQYLKSKGIKIGLATSTVRERATGYLVDHGIYDYFDALIFGDMVEHGKPAPDIFLKACEELKALPEETIAVEDSINGIKSASAAGTYPVMVVDLIEPNDEVKPLAKKIYRIITDIKELI